MVMEPIWTENWQCLQRFLPAGWKEMAHTLGAWRRRPRSIPSTEALLRLLLIHLADGCSLRESVVRAQQGNIADISDVALLKRLRASGEWLRWMASEILRRRMASYPPPAWLEDYRVRAVDASVICEPGSTGTDWRCHYSLDLCGLRCDEFLVTGPKVGESFARFHISSGDLMLGDRAYGHLKGFRYVLDHEGHFLTRLKNKAFTLRDAAGNVCSLASLVTPLQVGEPRDWALWGQAKGQEDLPLRICALRLSEEAAEQSVRRAKAELSKKQRTLDPETLALHRYVILATSLPGAISTGQILELYRARWQIELAFKRLKSIMGLGHLPKEDDESAKAWLHGKLLVSCLAQAIVDEGRSFSPWGYPL
jgi:transposase